MSEMSERDRWIAEGKRLGLEMAAGICGKAIQARDERDCEDYDHFAAVEYARAIELDNLAAEIRREAAALSGVVPSGCPSGQNDGAACDNVSHQVGPSEGSPPAAPEPLATVEALRATLLFRCEMGGWAATDIIEAVHRADRVLGWPMTDFKPIPTGERRPPDPKPEPGALVERMRKEADARDSWRDNIFSDDVTQDMRRAADRLAALEAEHQTIAQHELCLCTLSGSIHLILKDPGSRCELCEGGEPFCVDNVRKALEFIDKRSREQCNELRALEADNARLRKALEPFANAAKYWCHEAYLPHERVGLYDGDDCMTVVLVSDLREARAARDAGT